MNFELPTNVDLGDKSYPIPISKAMLMPLATSETIPNGLHITDEANGLDINQIYGDSDVTVTIKDNKSGAEETFRYVDGVLEVSADTPVVEAEDSSLEEAPGVEEFSNKSEVKNIKGFSKKTVPSKIKSFSKKANKYSMKQFSRPPAPKGAIDKLCSKFGKYKNSSKLGDDVWAYYYEIDDGFIIKWNGVNGKPNGQIFLMATPKSKYRPARTSFTWDEEKANDKDYIKSLEDEIEVKIEEFKSNKN